MGSSVPNERNQGSETRYNEIIKSRPKSKGWLYEDLILYNGFWISSNPALKCLIFIEDHRFISNSSDIILATCPKSGTTWLKALLFATVHRTSYDFSTHPLLTSNPHDIVPFFEQYIFQDPSLVDHLPSPGLFSTHLPFTLIPEYIASHCRFVYLCRDPKDVFVSSWHFARKIRSKKLPPLALEDAFEMFCNGVSHFGPYWDQVLSYWKVSLENPEKVLFLKYEDMKREPVVHVKRLADFIGKPFSMEEENEGVVDEIISLCSFEKMSNLEVNKNGIRGFPCLFNNSDFFRRGEVGDWRNKLTIEMATRMDQITKEKFHGSGLIFD